MWNLYAFNNYFLDTDRDYAPAEVWDLLKQVGYGKAYFSVNLKNPDSWVQAQAIRAQRRRTGLGLAAAYTTINLRDPAPAGAHGVVELLDLLDRGDTLELALYHDGTGACSDPVHDALALDVLGPWVDAARERGVTLSLYHHLGFWVERIDDCVRLAARFDDPAVGVTFCGYHWYAVDRQDLAGKLERAAPYLKLANVCGSRPRPEGSDFPLDYTIEPVGAGDFPLAAMIAGLRAIGFQGDVGFQGFKVGGVPAQTLKRSLTAFEQAVAASGGGG